jgi:glycosyltransferase involved in cell wall biosynthesis
VSPAQYPYGFRPAPAWLEAWHAQYPALAGRALVTLPARLTRWKGHEDFIRVIGDLVRRGENVHGLVVGAPHPRKQAYARELEGGVAAAGLRDRISFTGHRTDLREIMSLSAVVLSLSNVPEAFGRTVLEALSLGVPVAAYDHGGAGEVLEAVFPAGRVPPADPSAVSFRVSEFLRQRPQVPAHNPFTLQRMLDATLDLYQGLCAETRPGA